jgi:FKBP-type peptidyl-prolyl cis-trans isomerase FkpA
MPKKQTLIITLVVLLACLLVTVSIWFIWTNFVSSSNSNNINTSEYSDTKTLNPNSSADTISLQPKASASNQDSGGLKVDNSQNISTNLGSGSRQTANVSGGTSSGEDFSQYNQYIDKNEVYFGDLVVGTGAEAVKDSQLAVTYKGYLTNGQVFDQSRPANNGQLQPFLFTLGGGQVIPGFEQGVAGMKVGGVRRVIIPPSLGYGNQAQGSIPAGSVLVFDISLTAAQ